MQPRMSVARCCCGTPLYTPWAGSQFGHVFWDYITGPPVQHWLAWGFDNWFTIEHIGSRGGGIIFGNINLAPGTVVSAATVEFQSTYSGSPPDAPGVVIDILGDVNARTAVVMEDQIVPLPQVTGDGSRQVHSPAAEDHLLRVVLL